MEMYRLENGQYKLRTPRDCELKTTLGKSKKFDQRLALASLSRSARLGFAGTLIHVNPATTKSWQKPFLKYFSSIHASPLAGILTKRMSALRDGS